MKARRQIGARHVAWMRGAFLDGRACPNQQVGQPTNPEADGATRGAGALTGGLHHIGTDDFRDLSGEAAAAGLNIAQFA